MTHGMPQRRASVTCWRTDDPQATPASDPQLHTPEEETDFIVFSDPCGLRAGGGVACFTVPGSFAAAAARPVTSPLGRVQYRNFSCAM
jgi:hypothetical protein